ncbi:hypothetical protein BKA93DRAFT_746891 [Sparassis latifolia]
MLPQRFLLLYLRLFAGGADFWANSQQHFDLRMDVVMGCPDEAVLVIAEILALAHWKVAECVNRALRGSELSCMIEQSGCRIQFMQKLSVLGRTAEDAASIMGWDSLLSEQELVYFDSRPTLLTPLLRTSTESSCLKDA